MRAGEIITHVTLPLLPQNTKSLYLKRRDRASYEFALASAAVVIEMAGRFAGHRLHWVVSGRSRGDHRRNTLWQDLIPVNRPFGERLRRRSAGQNRNATTHSMSNWRSARLFAPYRHRRRGKGASR